MNIYENFENSIKVVDWYNCRIVNLERIVVLLPPLCTLGPVVLDKDQVFWPLPPYLLLGPGPRSP